MVSLTDFDKISDVVDDHERLIKSDFGDEYRNLSKSEKKQVLLELFFSRNGGDYRYKYSRSAEKLREGLEPYYLGGGFKEPEPPTPPPEPRGKYAEKYKGFAWFS